MNKGRENDVGVTVSEKALATLDYKYNIRRTSRVHPTAIPGV